jgi:predicted lipid carrier protein YhbT
MVVLIAGLMSLHPAPPVSPVLLCGLLVRPLPIAPLQPVLRAGLRAMRRRHAEAFARLATLAGKLIVIDPVDLPHCLALAFTAAGELDLRIADADDRGRADATVRGPFLALVELLEGRSDGDALFFSRDLVIEGDTEAVLILRNALDGADIDVVADLAAGLGPLARPAAALAKRARRLFGHIADDVETLRAAIVAPLVRRIAGQESAQARLDERVARLEQGARPRRRAVAASGRGH